MKKTALALAFSIATIGGAATGFVQDVCGPFTDVSPALCPYVLEMYYLGITAGTSATTYSPDSSVTRGQAAVFVSKGVNQAVARSSRRAALGQWWTTTPHWDLGLGVTNVGPLPQSVVFDGADVWTANYGDGSVSRVRASDGTLLETWTGAESAFGVLAAMGRVFVIGRTDSEESGGGKLYMIDPSQSSGPVTLLSDSLWGGPWAIAFDGAHIWVTSKGGPNDVGGALSIVQPGTSYPWASTTIQTDVVDPTGILFDGRNIWFGDSGDVSLKKVDATGTLIKQVPLAGAPGSVVFDGANIWVASVVGTVTVVSTASGSILATLTGNGINRPGSLAFDGSRILLTNVGMESVSLWRAADLTPLGSFPVTGPGNLPLGAASDGVNFWVTLVNSNKLARF